MSVADLVAAGRRAEERVMIDSCVIARTGSKTFNESTGTYTNTPVQEYSGKCRVKLNLPFERQGGDRNNQVMRPELRIPAVAGVITERAKVTVASQNPALDGRVFVIVAETTGSTSSSRRFIIEDGA